MVREDAPEFHDRNRHKRLAKILRMYIHIHTAIDLTCGRAIAAKAYGTSSVQFRSWNLRTFPINNGGEKKRKIVLRDFKNEET